MGRKYSQITIEERCEIARLYAMDQTLRQIAATLDRAPSTITRELKRNRSKSTGYQPGYAHQQARARRWSGSRLDRDSHLRTLVLSRLQQGWSPQQVAGRLAREAGQPLISHESIYRFIYAQLARKKDYSWRHYLPRAKAKRGWRGRRGGSPASFITLRCDTHSPWQKGGVENAIGRLRRTLPRKTDLAALPEHQFTALVQAYNNTPRKCLDYQTPAEIFWNSLLHFKCESIPSLVRG
ncbi:MAG: IS30 family transposase [Chloroflexi bacterium]|nr:IS30 family transposase [Chloroflexota bacterium]